MSKISHPVEKLVKILTYKGVEFEVVERPDVIWVGCVDYAVNNIDESDIGATFKRYREELINVTKQDRINPDWSAALSINYCCDEKIMITNTLLFKLDNKVFFYDYNIEPKLYIEFLFI